MPLHKVVSLPSHMIPPTLSFKRVLWGNCHWGQSMEHTQFGIKDRPLSAAESPPSHLLPTLGLSQEVASLFEVGMGPSSNQQATDGTDPMPSPGLEVQNTDSVFKELWCCLKRQVAHLLRMTFHMNPCGMAFVLIGEEAWSSQERFQEEDENWLGIGLWLPFKYRRGRKHIISKRITPQPFT